MGIHFVYVSSWGIKTLMPLGIAQLASVMRSKGCNVKVSDMRFIDKDVFLRSVRPDEIVCISSASDVAKLAIDLVRRIKVFGNIVICGGVHASIAPQDFLNAGADFVCIGEADDTLPELVDAIERDLPKANVAGIAYMDNGVIKKTSRRQPPDLDKLPMPAYDLFQETFKYTLSWTNKTPFTHLITCRGCPYDCSFCQPVIREMFGHRIRKLSPDKIVEILSYLQSDFGIREVLFEDDLFLSTYYRKHLYTTLDEMKKESISIRWTAQARATGVDRGLLAKAKEAGLYKVMVGLESGSQKILDFYHKGIIPTDAEKCFNLLHELDLFSLALIIVGAPIETSDDLRQTHNLLQKCRPDEIWMSTLTIYPHTHLYDKLLKENTWFEKDYGNLNRANGLKKVYTPLTQKQLFRFINNNMACYPSIPINASKAYRQEFKTKFSSPQTLLKEIWGYYNMRVHGIFG